MSITIDRKNLLDLIADRNQKVMDIDRKIHTLMLEKAEYQRVVKAAQETLTALNRSIESIEVVELKFGIIPIPGYERIKKTDQLPRAYIPVRTMTIMVDKYNEMDILSDCKVAVQIDSKKFALTTLDIKRSLSSVVRGINPNGIDIIEYAEHAYIDADTYQKFYLQAKDKWIDESLVRSGLKARLVQTNDRSVSSIPISDAQAVRLGYH